MTDESQSLDQTLDQTLNQTDFGSVINDNKKIIIGIGLVIVISIIAYSFYSNQSKKAYQASLVEAYTFESEVVIPFNEGKINSTEFLSKVGSLPAHIKGTSSLVPSLFTAIDKITKEGKEKEAIEILESWKANFAKSSFMTYFISLKLAPLYENSNEYDKAIDLLQNLIASKIDIMKSRAYLDIGRIYMKKGDKDLAQTNFKFIIENYKDSESAKLANLYLNQK